MSYDIFVLSGERLKMAVVPYMTFQTYNPVETGIKSYSAMADALRAHKESQMKQQMMPLQMQSLENQLALQRGDLDLLQYKGPTAQANLRKLQAQSEQEAILNNYLNDIVRGGSSGNLDTISGNDLRSQILRKKLGLPDQTPQEKYDQDLRLHAEKQKLNKDFENTYGTSQTLTTKQKQLMGIEQIMPQLAELLETDVPNQRSLPSITSPNAQARYEQLVNSMLETYIGSKGLASNEKQIHAAEKILRRAKGEDIESYRERLKDTMHEMGSIYQELSGREFRNTRPHRQKQEMIQIKSPSGKIKLIPSSEVEAAIAAGGQRV